jgi:3-oxoacyl-[acyl-carrier protein] reductase
MHNVVVTGGSRGLGLAICRRLTDAGYRVLALARHRNDQLDAAMEQANGSRPGSFHFVPFDLAEIRAIPAVVKTIRDEIGSIYGLVNNAAQGTPGILANMHVSHIEQLIHINTLSPIVLTKCVVPHMMAEKQGRIVNISSVIGFTGYSGLSVYGATKASMIGFTRSLAREVGQLGVTVNAVAPGFMHTEMTESLGPDQRAQIARRNALRRFPETEDVANAVEFLLDAKARNITGTVLTVDAGATA